MANILPANSEIPFYIVINQSSPPPIPMFYMFEVQIFVDAYPVFDLKRRSLLFAIDTGTHAKGVYKTPMRVSFSMQNRGKLPFLW